MDFQVLVSKIIYEIVTYNFYLPITQFTFFVGLKNGLIMREWSDLMDYVSIECDGKDYTKELKDYGVHSIMFLNIKVCIRTISELELGLSFLCHFFFFFDFIDGALSASSLTVSVRSTDLTQAANRESVFYEIKINLT